MIPPLSPHLTPFGPTDSGPLRARPDDAALMASARALEAGFLAAMLQAAGAGTPRETFGGGAGEAQFSSFLVQAQAEAMVERGGIKLAESLFTAMRGRNDGGS